MAGAPALTHALTGATAVFILPPSEFDPEPGYPEAQAVIDAVVQAVTAAKPNEVLCLSTIGADAVHDNLLAQRAMMEAALRVLPLPLTILRPAWFIDNLSGGARPPRVASADQAVLATGDQSEGARSPEAKARTIARKIDSIIGSRTAAFGIRLPISGLCVQCHRRY
jgi:NAD(P)H dehydrogenase (quinone)